MENKNIDAEKSQGANFLKKKCSWCGVETYLNVGLTSLDGTWYCSECCYETECDAMDDAEDDYQCKMFCGVKGRKVSEYDCANCEYVDNENDPVDCPMWSDLQ